MGTVSRGEATLEDVVAKIAGRKAALFFGAGVAIGCGGPSGGELLAQAKGRFGAAGPERRSR